MAKRPNSDSLACPQAVLGLVQRFDEHRETYKRQTYNEAQVRREFIDPLFDTLGWDVDNKAGHAEAYKDVIHEDAIKVGGTTKAPDDLTPHLTVDDRVLKDIVSGLYYPECPYEFSVLPVDILGDSELIYVR